MPKPRVPSKLKKLRGTDKPYRMLANEVDFDELKDITAPKMLNKVGREEWDRMAPMLRERGLLTKADKRALIEYCWIVSKMDHIFNNIDDDDLTFVGATGQTIINPLFKVYVNLSERFVKLSNLFGFTPADRTRINMPIKTSTHADLAQQFIRRSV